MAKEDEGESERYFEEVQKVKPEKNVVPFKELEKDSRKSKMYSFNKAIGRQPKIDASGATSPKVSSKFSFKGKLTT